METHELAAAVKAAQSGDKAAIEQLYRHYRSRIWFFVCKNIGSKQAAEDIVSDTFLTAIEKLCDLRSADAFGSWLYSIAYSKCLIYLNARSAATHFSSDTELESTIQNSTLSEPVKLPQDYIESEQTKQQLREAIDSLKPEMRSAVIMYYFEEMTVAQVAQALGINENAAKQKLYQARKKLSAKLKRLCRNGTALCVVPLGAVMNAVLESSTAAASTAGAAIKTGFTVKLAAAFISGALAVGVPIALLDRESRGDYRPEQTTQQQSAELKAEASELLTSLRGLDFEYRTQSAQNVSDTAGLGRLVEQHGKSVDTGLPKLFLDQSDKWRLSVCSEIDERSASSVTMHYSQPLSDLKLYCSPAGDSTLCRLYMRKYPDSSADAGKYIRIELTLPAQNDVIYTLLHPDVTVNFDCKSQTMYEPAPMTDSTGQLGYSISCTGTDSLYIELTPSKELLCDINDVTFSAAAYAHGKAHSTSCMLAENGNEHYFTTAENITYQLRGVLDSQKGSWCIALSELPQDCDTLKICLNYKRNGTDTGTSADFTTILDLDMTQVTNAKGQNKKL